MVSEQSRNLFVGKPLCITMVILFHCCVVYQLGVLQVLKSSTTTWNKVYSSKIIYSYETTWVEKKILINESIHNLVQQISIKLATSNSKNNDKPNDGSNPIFSRIWGIQISNVIKTWNHEMPNVSYVWLTSMF